MVKMLKLLRVGRLVRYFSQFEALVLNVWPHNVLRLMKIVFVVVLFSHWNGCVQYLIALWEGFPSDSWVVRDDARTRPRRPLPGVQLLLPSTRPHPHPSI